MTDDETLRRGSASGATVRPPAHHDDAVNSMSEFHGRTGPGGTGWRASLAFFYAWLMNWERISAYDGGWCEWRRDPDNPVAPGGFTRYSLSSSRHTRPLISPRWRRTKLLARTSTNPERENEPDP